MTLNIHNIRGGKTCHDRTVRQAFKFVGNALEGEYKKKEVSYITGE